MISDELLLLTFVLWITLAVVIAVIWLCAALSDVFYPLRRLRGRQSEKDRKFNRWQRDEILKVKTK